MKYTADIRIEGYLTVDFEADAGDAGAGEGWDDALQAKIAKMDRTELIDHLDAECVRVYENLEDIGGDGLMEVFAR